MTKVYFWNISIAALFVLQSLLCLKQKTTLKRWQRLSQSHADAMVGHNHLDMLTLRVSQKVADSLFEVSVHGVRQTH